MVLDNLRGNFISCHSMLLDLKKYSQFFLKPSKNCNNILDEDQVYFLTKRCLKLGNIRLAL